MSEADEVPEAVGPYHDFWLFREGEREYEDYWGLLGRKDAPLRILDDLLRYMYEPLTWVPVIHDKNHHPTGRGLYWYSSTVIGQAGGECLRQICSGWAQIMSQGPDPLIMTMGWTQVDDDESTREPYRIKTPRDEYVADLRKLAEYGRLVATGEYFLLHLGI